MSTDMITPDGGKAKATLGAIAHATDTLLQMIGGTYAPWQDPDEKTGLFNVINPKATFYADVSEPFASEATNHIYGQSLLSFNSPSGPVHYQDADYSGRRVYLHTTQDQALPPFAQGLFVSGSGVAWNVVQLDTSHSPFLSIPEQLADIVQGEVQAFVASFQSMNGTKT